MSNQPSSKEIGKVDGVSAMTGLFEIRLIFQAGKYDLLPLILGPEGLVHEQSDYGVELVEGQA